MTDAVPTFFEKRAEAVPLVGCIPLFQRWVSKKRRAMAIGSYDWLIAQKIGRILLETCLFEIRQVRVGVVANEVAGIVPGAKQATAVRLIHTHSTNKESSFDLSPGKRSKNALICLVPIHLRAYVHSRIIHGERDLWALGLKSAWEIL